MWNTQTESSFSRAFATEWELLTILSVPCDSLQYLQQYIIEVSQKLENWYFTSAVNRRSESSYYRTFTYELWKWHIPETNRRAYHILLFVFIVHDGRNLYISRYCCQLVYLVIMYFKQHTEIRYNWKQEIANRRLIVLLSFGPHFTIILYSIIL